MNEPTAQYPFYGRTPEPKQAELFLCKLIFEAEMPIALTILMPRDTIEKILALAAIDTPADVFREMENGRRIGMRPTNRDEVPLPYDADAIIVEAYFLSEN